MLVQSSIYDELLPKLKEALKISQLHPFDENVKMSAQTGPDQLEKKITKAEDDDKANILTGGHRITDNGLDKGYYFGADYY